MTINIQNLIGFIVVTDTSRPEELTKIIADAMVQASNVLKEDFYPNTVDGKKPDSAANCKGE